MEHKIEKDSGGHIVSFRVMNKGKPVHSAGFGIVGEQIKQTPKLIATIAEKVGARCWVPQEKNSYFVLALNRACSNGNFKR